jgi:hypothetical protein
MKSVKTTKAFITTGKMFETIDELHTLSTSLGNTIFNLQEKKAKALAIHENDLAAYFDRCIRDARKCLGKCELAFLELEK